MSKEAAGVGVRRKTTKQFAIQWTGNGCVPDLKLFLAGLDCRILVDPVDFGLVLKWESHTTRLPLGGWLVRNPEFKESMSLSYYKSNKELFDDFEYTEPLPQKA
jgi:hypothetical protein